MRPAKINNIGWSVSQFSLYAVCVLVIFTSLAFLRLPGLRMLLSDLLFPVVNLLAVGAFVFAAQRTYQYSRQAAVAWLILGFAQFSFVLGDAAWAVIELWTGEPPFPSAADVFYLAYYPLFLAGALHLPLRTGKKLDIFKQGLDMSIVLVSTILMFWTFLIGPMLQAASGQTLLARILSVSYPVGDLLLLSAMLILLYYNWQGRNRISIIALFASSVVMVATDIVFSFQSLNGTYESGGFLDLGWITVYLLSGFAAFWQGLTAGKESQQPTPLDLEWFENRLKSPAMVLLPYLWALLAYGLLVYHFFVPTEPSRFLIVIMMVGFVVVLVVGRQLLAFYDHQLLLRDLRNALEKVQQQAGELKKTNQQLALEIEERQRAEQQLSYDALHDSLTNLPNRMMFTIRLSNCIENKKTRSDYLFSVLSLDLDHFKKVNDSLGHSTGDFLLIAVANRLKNCLRSSDTVARLGGDEFVLLIENTQDENSILRVVAKIQDCLRSPYLLDGHEIIMSASIGVLHPASDYSTADEIIRDTDIAMYRAKAQGRGRAEFFNDAMRSKAVVRLQIENELRQASALGQFRLFYQPIFALASTNGARQVIGFEALLRWQHPSRGLLSPDEFIWVAEETGFINTIGQWVLAEACAQMRRWHEQFPHFNHLTINVNISANQFSQPGFAQQVDQALRSADLQPCFLGLEITESLFMSSRIEDNGVFLQLRELGVAIHIDDFGMGYSSLSYLQRFPVQAIKIDKSFIHEINTSGKGFELVRAIVLMAQNLGMETVAEGVETEEQLKTLRELMCNYVQGYYYARPMEAGAAQCLLLPV